MNTSTASTGLRGLIATTIFGALASSFSAVSAADPGLGTGEHRKSHKVTGVQKLSIWRSTEIDV
jgi:hypothetical protein